MEDITGLRSSIQIERVSFEGNPQKPSNRCIVYHHRTRGDGAEGIHVNEMIKAFRNLGNVVHLVCPATSKRELGISLGMKGITKKQTQSKKGKIKLLLTQTLELLYNAVSFTRLTWKLIRFRPDFVYERYSCYHFGGAAACRLLKVPMVLEVNSTYAGRFQRRQLAFPGTCSRIEKWVFQASRYICVVSEPLKQCVMERGVTSDNILVTPNAINPEQKISSNEIRERIRNDLGIEDDSVVIGFVGSLRRWHGIEFLAQAIPEIVERCPQSIFLIVGTGELEEELRTSVQRNNLGRYVRLTGGVPYQKVPGFIQAMDIGVMPDSNEWGSPMKILEYMLQGKPVVAPKIEPIEEIIANGKTGVLFHRLDSASFISGLSRLVMDMQFRNHIGHLAQSYVLSDRKWSDNAGKVLDLFQRKQDRLTSSSTERPCE